MAEAYDPHWSVLDPEQPKWTFVTTRCKEAVSPSEFVDLKFFCPKGKCQIRTVSVQFKRYDFKNDQITAETFSDKISVW